MEENKKVPNPQVRKKRRKKRRSYIETIRDTFLYIVFVLTVSVMISFVVIKLSNDMFAFIKEDNDVIVIFDEDEDVDAVTDKLYEQGVIEYQWFFKAFVNLMSSDSTFTVGTHEVNSNMDYREILNELAKSTTESSYVETVTVTIPEGYTLEQIAELMEEKEVVTYDEFIDTAVNYEFSHYFLEEHEDVIYQLEGYLFPDTYEFYVNDDPVSVINKMLNNFESRTWEIIEALEDTELYDVDLHELITIASLIEREAAKEEEQATISGVIYNRLASSAYPFLNIDATIQYAAGHREEILQVDLDEDGPYNTYTRTGLPAGPIANAGLDAIMAAFEPEDHGYYFYVAKSDGYHIFTTNLTEHNAAVASVRSGG